MLPHRELRVFSYFKDTPIDIQKRKGKMKEEKELKKRKKRAGF